MADAVPPPRKDGRSPAWRLGMAVAGAAFGAAGVALVLWPRLLAYAVGGAFGLLALFCLVSAVAARGR
jgi:hypothetical protein